MQSLYVFLDALINIFIAALEVDTTEKSEIQNFKFLGEVSRCLSPCLDGNIIKQHQLSK